MVNYDGVEDGLREEAEEEIGIWFPLLDLFCDYGKFLVITKEAVGVSEEGWVWVA